MLVFDIYKSDMAQALRVETVLVSFGHNWLVSSSRHKMLVNQPFMSPWHSRHKKLVNQPFISITSITRRMVHNLYMTAWQRTSVHVESNLYDLPGDNVIPIAFLTTWCVVTDWDKLCPLMLSAYTAARRLMGWPRNVIVRIMPPQLNLASMEVQRKAQTVTRTLRIDSNYVIERYKFYDVHCFCCGAECEDADESNTDATRESNCARCKPCNLCEDCTALDRLGVPVCLDCIDVTELDEKM